MSASIKVLTGCDANFSSSFIDTGAVSPGNASLSASSMTIDMQDHINSPVSSNGVYLIVYSTTFSMYLIIVSMFLSIFSNEFRRLSTLIAIFCDRLLSDERLNRYVVQLIHTLF